MLEAEWYEGVARSRRRFALFFKVATAGFTTAALFSLLMIAGWHEAGRAAAGLGLCVFGAFYTAVHAGSCEDQAERYERDAEAAPAINAENRRLNAHYQMMNRDHGCRYEKIDDGWWSENPTLLEEYAGLVARWKPGGDLHND